MSLQPHRPDPDAALAADVTEKLLRAASIVRDRLADALAEAGSNETRLTVMRTIAARGDEGCSQADLAFVLRQAESSVCTLIERMKKDGLVHRFRSKVDRRKSFLMLTSEGADRLQEAVRGYEAAVAELSRAWRSEAEPLRRLLDQLLFALERPVPGSSDLDLRKAA